MSTEENQENGVTLSMILISFSLIVLVLLLTLPNIYLDNNIYYESRKIAHYESVKLTLEEEQHIIKTKLEEINYRENFQKQEVW